MILLISIPLTNIFVAYLWLIIGKIYYFQIHMLAFSQRMLHMVSYFEQPLYIVCSDSELRHQLRRAESQMADGFL
jgi:hypothetical protein